MSGSLIFDQYFLGKFCLHGDVEWVKINWGSSDKNEEKTFFDCAVKYLYDEQINVSLGITNKFILDEYTYNYVKAPLFLQTDKISARVKIKFEF